MAETLPSALNDEESVFDYQRNVTISNFIMHSTCQLYFTFFKKKWMPISFVEFVFNEFKRYSKSSTAVIQDFFGLYKTTDLIQIVEDYERNFYTLITDSKKIGEELHLKISNNDYMALNLSETNLFGDYDPDLYKSLDGIYNHIYNSDELLTIKELYQNFMIRKVVLSLSNRNRNASPNLSKNSGAQVTKAITSQTLSAAEQVTSPAGDTTLIGSESDVPDQKGRVTKIYFPKIALPSPYPVLQEKSRINSEHRARRFAPTDKEVLIVNKYKFNRIKYKTGFIEKRKAAQKTTKRKFDFDF